MESSQPNRMQAIVAMRYAPLVLPQPLNAFPGGDYLKYLPRFNRQSETSVEEHWNAYYSYVDNQNIENEDVWMRVFVQILDGEARKCFRELPVGSRHGIEVLEEVFMKQWGDVKDHLYYLIDFSYLKRKSESQLLIFQRVLTRCMVKFLQR